MWTVTINTISPMPFVGTCSSISIFFYHTRMSVGKRIMHVTASHAVLFIYINFNVLLLFITFSFFSRPIVKPDTEHDHQCFALQLILSPTHFIVLWVPVYTIYYISWIKKKKADTQSSPTNRILCTGAKIRVLLPVIVDTSCAHPAAALYITYRYTRR